MTLQVLFPAGELVQESPYKVGDEENPLESFIPTRARPQSLAREPNVPSLTRAHFAADKTACVCQCVFEHLQTISSVYMIERAC